MLLSAAFSLESYFASSSLRLWLPASAPEKVALLFLLSSFCTAKAYGGWGRVLRTPPLPFPREKESATSVASPAEAPPEHTKRGARAGRGSLPVAHWGPRHSSGAFLCSPHGACPSLILLRMIISQLEALRGFRRTRLTVYRPRQ